MRAVATALPASLSITYVSWTTVAFGLAQRFFRIGSSHVEAPQNCVAGQACPHTPQWLELLVVSTHEPSQHASAPAQPDPASPASTWHWGAASAAASGLPSVASAPASTDAASASGDASLPASPLSAVESRPPPSALASESVAPPSSVPSGTFASGLASGSAASNPASPDVASAPPSP